MVRERPGLGARRRRRPRARRSTVGLIALVAAATWGHSTRGEPTIHQEAREVVTVAVRPLTVRAVAEPAAGFVFALEGSSPAELEMLLEWPAPSDKSRLRLRGTRQPGPAGDVVRLVSELSGIDGSNPRQATREIALGDGPATALFEVSRAAGDRVLTLVVEAELTRTTAFTVRPVAGAPVRFRLDIEWTENGRTIPLEINELQTFVGEMVSYSFRMGEPGEAESGRIDLLPLQLVGETARIEVALSGTLPDGEGGIKVVSRKEQWVSTSGTTSALSLAAGEPPVGFRFLVTPRF